MIEEWRKPFWCYNHFYILKSHTTISENLSNIFVNTQWVQMFYDINIIISFWFRFTFVSWFFFLYNRFLLLWFFTLIFIIIVWLTFHFFSKRFLNDESLVKLIKALISISNESLEVAYNNREPSLVWIYIHIFNYILWFMIHSSNTVTLSLVCRSKVTWNLSCQSIEN